jgi:acyl-CoA thioester hydrolase
MKAKHSEYTMQVRVYYEDTDAGGVVFYVNYLKFLERARTEWLRELDINQSAMATQARGLFLVRCLDLAYHKPAKLDDLLTLRSRVTRLGRVSLHFAQRVERDGELLAEGNIKLCYVDAEDLRPVAIPTPVRAKLDFIQESLCPSPTTCR